MFHIQELQDKLNSWNDAQEFHDPEIASSSRLSHVPSQPMSLPSPGGMISRESCLKSDTRNSLGTSGHVFEGLPARGETSSALLENFQGIVASSSSRLNPIDVGKIAEPPDFLQHQLRALPRKLRPGTFYTVQKNLFSKLFDAKSEKSDLGTAISFPDSTDVQCSKVNFKTEICSNSRCPTIAMLWIKEVEVAKSVDDLMTSQSIEGRFSPFLKCLMRR